MRQSARRALLAAGVILCAVLVLKGSALLVPSGSWAPEGTMANARAGASAALLQDGRILITGGDPGTGQVATADFLATDGTISAAPPMINARSQHVSVALQDGRVLVAGGLTVGGGVTNAAEIYDPVANSWTSVGAGMIEARSGATAAVLQDGRVAIAGGQNGTIISSTIEIFDPAVGTFTYAGMMSSPRTQHAMAELQDGRVLIVGGNSGNTGTPPAPTPVASTDIFDPVARTVSAGPVLNTARYNHSATTLLNGQVVVIGGNNGNSNPAQMDVTPAELVDFTVATPAFTTLATNLATPREGHLAFLLPNNNNILIAGGTSAGTTIASAELFTAQGAPPSVWTYSFGSTGTMTAARSSAAGSANQVNATSTVMQRNGMLMVAGGADANGNALTSTEAYGYATVQTDASEYAPGSPVTITGSGWVPGETVTISFLESPYFDAHPNLTAVADANGNISNNQFSPDQHDIGIMFFLTATGSVSQAQNTFADNNIQVFSAPTGVTFTLIFESFTSSNCTGTPTSSGTPSIQSSGKGTVGIGNPVSVSLQAPALSDQGGAFQSWGWVTPLTNEQVAAIGSTTALATPTTTDPICVEAIGTKNTVNDGTFTATYSTTAVAPTLNSVSPNTGDLGTIVSTVTLTGTNFVADSSVSFGPNITVNSTTVNSSTQITASITISTSASALGAQSVTVKNPGSGGGSATSNAQTFTVNPRTTTTAIAPASASAPTGGTASFTITVKDTDTGTATTPTGTVSFTDTSSPTNTDSFSTCTLAQGTNPVGTATCTTTVTASSPAGAHTINAGYTANDNVHANSSTTIPATLTVTTRTTTTTITPTSATTSIGGTASFTITVRDTNTGTATTPTGTISFTDTSSPANSDSFSTCTLAQNVVGTATCTTTVSATTPAGAHTINASYTPNDNVHATSSTTTAATLTVTTRTTTTTIAPTSASASIGATAQFTITVKDTSAGTVSNPAGTVSFTDISSPANTDSLSTCTLAQGANSVGTVSCTVTATATAPAGAHTINATYAPNDNVHATSSTTSAATLTVTTRATTTTIAPRTATAPIGGSAMFTITVTDTDNGPVSTPVGTVAFTDTSSPSNTDSITPCTLAQSVTGTATCTVTVAPSAPAGPHTISASFAATDGVHAASSTTTSAALNVFNAATTTTVTSSANPSVFGQGVYFTATVAPQQSGLGLGTPAGTVQFVIDGTNFSGAVTLSAAGAATSSTISTLSVGTHTITATYTPAANSVFQTSSGSLTQTVSQDGTATLIMSSPNPSTFGQTVAIAITVAASAPGSGTPTGTVSFLIDNAPATVLTLVGGSATTSTSSLSVGSHTFTANYSGDGNFTASMASATQVVSQATTSTALMLNPSTINFGESTTVTATVTDTSMGSTGTPSGTVTVSDGIGNATGDSCTIKLSSGTGTCVLTPSATAPGGSTVTGTYSGDTNFQASTGTTSLTVNAATTTTTLASPANNPSILGQTVAFTATVMDTSSGDTAVPNGTVNFFDGGTMLIGSATLNASGNATFTTALLSSSASPHSITAAFMGNADFSASMTSSAVSQTVNPRSTSTTVALSPMQVVVGQPSTATVTVTDTPPATPAGTPGAFALASQSLNVGRTGHATAQLPNGTVLIAGGEDASSNVLNSAEIYDPVAGSFSTLSVTLSAPRTGATAALLNNGTVLIAGGSSDGTTALASAEIYDPVAGTFTALAGAGQSLGAARFGHTATLLPNGNVLIAGGQNSSGTLGSTEIYNASTQMFGAGPGAMGTARSGHTATLLPNANGLILFAGGSGLSSAELYNPSTGNSTPTGNMTNDRTNHAAALLPDGNVLIAGGTSSGSVVNSTELYNTAAGAFASAGNMQKARSGLTATMLDSAQVLVVGGSNSTYPALASGELYAPSFDPLGTVSVTSNDSTDGVTGTPCTLTLNGTGATTCQATDTPSEVGTDPHVITGTYQPAADQVHTGSYGSANLTVVKADTTTAVVSSANPSTYGQSVTFTATVSVVSPGSGSPTGTVNLYDGGTCAAPGTTLASALSLSGGTATFTTSVLSAAASPHSILACYSGDPNFNATGATSASTATSLTQIVKPAPTSTTVTSSANPSAFGQSVTFTATVMNTAGASVSTATPTGSVQFYIDGSAFGSPVAVAGSGATATGASGATATLTVSGSPHTIKATFTNSDGNFSGSYGLLNGGQTVQPAPTSTAVSSSQNPSIFGQSVTFTATLTNTAGAGISTATPTGSVQFYLDNVTFGTPVVLGGSGATASVSSGSTATLTVAGSPHTVTAKYVNADGNFSTSSGSLANGQTVNPAPTSTTVSSSKNPSIYGQSVTFTATVANAAGPGVSTATPTGSVQFYVDSVAFGSPVVLVGSGATASVSSGAIATLTVPGSPHTVKATYTNSDGNFSGSYGLLNGGQTVSPAPLTITASNGSMIYGGPVPPITPSYSGLVNGDTSTSLTTQPSCGTYATSSSPVGTYASFCSGAADPNYTISYSAGIVTVTPASTTTAVVSSSSNNTSTFMQLVTFTATVTPQFSGTPTGPVTFQDTVNGVTSTLGTASLSVVNGQDVATFSTASLQDAYPNIITAVYSGDSNGNGDGVGDFLESTSPAITQTVQPSPNVSLSPLFVSFGNLNVGQKSSPATVTLSNIGDAPLSIVTNGISITQPGTDFTQINNCPASLGFTAPNNFCTITITFAPVDTGIRTASLQITDNDDDSANAQQIVSLTGAGLSTITGGSLFTDAIFATANGCGSIVESGGSTVDSFSSAQGYGSSHQLSGGNVGTNGNVTLNGSKTTIYGSAAVDSLTAGNCSKTSVAGATTSGGAQVTGGLVALNGPITYPAPPAPNPAPQTINQNISGSCATISGCTNTGTKTVSLAPGPYGNLSVSGGTTAHVSRGTYSVNSLTLSGNSILYVDSGPVVVNLAGASLSGGNPAMDLSGGTIVNPSGIPANLQFTYAGSQGLNLSGGSESYATVYAPNAFVNMSGGSDFWGSIVASTVTNSGGTAIHYDTNLPNIPAGNDIWFSAVVNNVHYNGNPITSKAGQIKLYLTFSSISFASTSSQCSGTFSSGRCTLPVPNAVVTFNSASQTSGAKTTYDLTNSRWSTAVAPSALTGNTFVTGVAVPVPAGGFPGGIQNVSFQAAFSTDAPGVTLQWQWGAAVYTSFSTTYATPDPNANGNVLGVNAEDGSADAYGTDRAGTPETYKADVIFGATGGGGTNYTGYLSTPAGVVPTIAPMSVSPSSVDFGPQNQLTTSAAMTTILTNNDSAPHMISSLSVMGTNASDFTLVPSGPITPNNCVGMSSLAPGASCTLYVTFTPSDVDTRTAKIVINDDANNSPQTVYLSGTGH